MISSVPHQKTSNAPRLGTLTEYLAKEDDKNNEERILIDDFDKITKTHHYKDYWQGIIAPSPL